jgi:hypothetical protein
MEVFLINPSIAQNLVPNPSFEEYYSLPMEGYISRCKYWYTPRGLSPDYFHKEAKIPKNNYTSPIVSIPKNMFGWQQSKIGDAYVGITNIHIPRYTFREMIAVRLKKSLTKDSTYKISFYTSLAEGSMYYHDYFGITLSKDSLANLKTRYDYGKVIAPNSILVKIDSIGNDTANWHLVQTTYKAKGGEEYLYLGLTKKNMNRFRYWITKYFRKTGWGDEPYAYYYIDDVSVIKVRD